MVLGHDILKSERTQDIKISQNVSFDSMLLSPNTLTGLKASGFYVPSPIQLHGIPLGKCGFDLLLEAKSGTGKTAVFTVIALEKINLEKGVQAIILAPTREIASQICDVIKTVGAYYKGLCTEVVMGGLPFTEDVVKFEKKVHIVVGSPGRLHHLIKAKHIDVSSVRLMVLDEADKLVEKSFLPDINYIFSQLPNQKQIIMSSATFPEDVRLVMNKYMQNAQHICPDTSSVLLGIKQNIILVPSHVNIVKQTQNRYEELHQILSKKEFKQCLVFCNYQVRVAEVHKMLNKDKWPADKLHGKQEQTDRLEALKVLQNYQCRILVSTDLAARGIDASNVDLVINFEPPHEWQTYLHRIGRAGRFGSYGIAITILCKGDEERMFKKLLESMKIPFDLKYFWNKEPYMIENCNINNDTNKKEEKEQPKIKEPVQTLGIKETYEELWKKLSASTTTESKDVHDIPSFESFNKSFQEANQESNADEIESFTDLLTSFQNHDTKSNEESNYKTVEVNKLIVPGTIFNRNTVMQSLLKSGDKVVKDKNYVNDNSCAYDKNQVQTINSGTNTSFSQLCKYDEKDDKASKNCKSDHNGASHRSDMISDTRLSKPDISAAGSTKRENCVSRRSSSSSLINEVNSHRNSPSDDVQSDTNKIFKANNRHDEYSGDVQPGSISNGRGNKHNGIDPVIQSELNEDEKALLAANLPIAFGKVKQKKCTKSSKNKVDFSESLLCKASRNNEHIIQKPLLKSVSSQLEPVNSYSSSEVENTDNVSERSVRYKTYSKSCKPEPNTGINYPRGYINSDRDIEERQQQFTLWYQQLRIHMETIEQSVYNEIMSSGHF